jgi:hypothetical protein
MSPFRLVTAVNLVILKLSNFSLRLIISHSYSVYSRSYFNFSILSESRELLTIYKLTLEDVLRDKLISKIIDKGHDRGFLILVKSTHLVA